MIDLILTLGGICLLALIGYTFGKIGEKKHYQSILAREEKYKNIMIFNEKIPPPGVSGQAFYLVTGATVISGDYFKQIVAGLKKFFGGRLTSFESMLDRGRREAMLRMKEEAHRHGASMIFNVSFQTAMLGQNDPQQKIFSAEILVYGTAWVAPKK